MQKFWIQVFCLAILFHAQPSQGSLRSFCQRVRNIAGIPRIEKNFALPDAKFEATDDRLGQRHVTISGTGIPTLSGMEIPPALYSIFSSEISRVTGVRVAGAEYSVFFLEGNSLLFPMELQRKVILRPGFFDRAGIWANPNILILPEIETMNRRLDRSNGQSEEFKIGPRFEAYKTILTESQTYSYERFFKSLCEGKILLAVKGSYGRHDQVQEHLEGALYVSTQVFAIPHRAATILRDFKEDITKIELTAAVKGLSQVWDEFTSELSVIVNRKQTVDEKRAALVKLLEFKKDKAHESYSGKAWKPVGAALDKIRRQKPQLIFPDIDPKVEADRLLKALAL